MAVILVFHMVLKKFLEITNNKFIFSQCNIFYKYNISFLNYRQKVNQIKNSEVCVVARLVFVFYCALTTGRSNAFQHIFANQKKSEFYSPNFQTVISCDYGRCYLF